MNPKPISTIIKVTVFSSPPMNFFSSRRRSVFGSNLGESWAAFPNIPQVVIACAEVIDAHGDTEGLFSTPGCRGIALKGERTLCVYVPVCKCGGMRRAREAADAQDCSSAAPCTGMTEMVVL